MEHTIPSILNPMFGQSCSRIQVGRNRTLSLGFGKHVPRKNPRGRDQFRGEWEIGTYQNGWRIIKTHDVSAVIHGAQDLCDSEHEFVEQIESLEFGRILSCKELTNFDIRVKFDSGLLLDVFSLTNDDDESFHVFCPNNIFVKFLPGCGWKVGPSNVPWESP